MDDGLLDGLCDHYRDVDLTFELERGRAHEVLRRRAAAADLLVLGRSLHPSALDLLPSPVTRPLLGRGSGVVAVVPH